MDSSACTIHRPADEAALPLEGNYFVAAYPPFSCWEATQATALRQALNTPADDWHRPLGMYFHIPFCLHRCEYCYYLSHAGKTRGQIDEYVDCLLRELSLLASRPAISQRSLRFAYFGGGTPSLLSETQMLRVFEALRASCSAADLEELTFECAPKTITKTRLVALRAGGVTRISLGIQQLDDPVLCRSGRIHGVADALRAYEGIRRAGFDYVNVDLIAGLAGQTDESFLRGLEEVIALRPESVTIYQLEIPRNTPLYKKRKAGEETDLADWSARQSRLAQGFDRLRAAGYTVCSGYMAVRDPRKHRFLYQSAQYRGDDLLGLGASSFGYFRGIHYQNCSDLEEYMNSLRDGRLPIDRAYELDAEERMTRRFVLELKLGSVSRHAFQSDFGVDPLDRFAHGIGELVRRNLLLVDPDRLSLTSDGLVRVDHLLPAFYLPRHRELAYW